jgi:hypothetical protein
MRALKSSSSFRFFSSTVAEIFGLFLLDVEDVIADGALVVIVTACFRRALLL